MLKVGITGNFGAGKSTVAAMFAKRGVVVIDADAIAHELLKNDLRVQKAVTKAFGSGVLEGKGIDRKALGQVVFKDRDALRLLESIIHPPLTREIRRRLKDIQKMGVRVAGVDAAILIEAGWVGLVDKLIVVKTKKEEQIRRVMARTGLDRTDVQKRLRQQMPVIEKCKYADFLVDNSGPKSDTDIKVERIWKNLFQK